MLTLKIAEAVQPVRKLKISEWVEKNIYLPKTSAEPGRIKLNRTPYAREILDAFCDENVHKVVVKSAAQIGKSTVLLGVIGYFVANDPSTIMLVHPTLETAQDFSKDRLSRLIQDCPILTPLFEDEGKTRNSNQTILSKFFTGGRIVLVGANSPSGLASKPIRILLCDEVDRFPLSAGSEGDSVALAEKRQTTFWNYKTGLFSTPTIEGQSKIDYEYNLGTQEQWQHKCPNCGEFHFLDYRQMVGVNPVKWRCPTCGFEFTQIEMANSEQKYFAQNPESKVRSFWINGFSSAWLTWEQIMKEYEDAKNNPTNEAVVFNTRFGMTYQLRGEFEDETQFVDGLENYGAELPANVKVLTAGVDVQYNRLECSIYGWDGEKAYGISHNVIYGMPSDEITWQNLDELLESEFSFADGRKLKIARTFIDSGFSTEDVYNYCKKNVHKGRFAIKGMSAYNSPLIHSTSVQKNGVVLIVLNSDEGKQQAFSLMESGNVHWGRNDEFLQRNFNELFFKQLIAEKRVSKQVGGVVRLVWQPVAKGVRNEALDCFSYSLSAYKSLQSAPAKTSAVKKVKSRSVDIWS